MAICNACEKDKTNLLNRKSAKLPQDLLNVILIGQGSYF